MIKSKILLAAVLLGSAVVADLHAADSDVQWAGPVKETKTYTQNDTSYVFVEGEWFATNSADKGNILYGDVVLNTDKEGILDIARRDTLKNHDSMDLRGHLEIVNDSILFFNFKNYELEDKARLINASTGEVLKVLALNARDSVVFGDLLERNAIVRISPEKNLAEIVNLAGIPSKKVEPAAVVPVADASEEGMDTVMLILIVAAIAMLMAIGVLAFLLFRAKKTMPYSDGNADMASDESFGIYDGAETRNDLDIDGLKHEVMLLSTKNNSLASQLAKTREDLETERTSRKQAIETEVSRVHEKAEREIVAAEQRAAKAEEKSRTIKQEVTDLFRNQIAGLESDVNRLETRLSETRAGLQETTEKLAAESAALAQSRRKVGSLEQAIARFDEKLGDASFARSYCKKIEKLLELSARVQKSANAALGADVEDPYFIFKAIARFGAQIDEINLATFYTDVDMVLSTGFVPKGTPLADYDPSLPEAELESLTKSYFFASYLKQYINALVVLNESMAGLSHLLPDMPAEMVRPFENYRGEIRTAVADLGINVLSVRIFDFVHNNTDLLATQVDGGFDTPGVILDIENCLVSLSGSPKDSSERIKVKVQQ